jgi:hypothetical protein
MRRSPLFRSVLVVCLLALVGCGSKKGSPVKGTVKFPPTFKFEENDTITITLDPEDPSNKENVASGVVSVSDGSFTIANALPGKYKIAINITSYPGSPEAKDRHKALELFNYTFDKANSGLSFEVKKGEGHTITVDLVNKKVTEE